MVEELVRFIETTNSNLKGYTLIEGFPDLGLAGTIGSRFLVDKMKLNQIGFIESKLFLPIIRIHEGVPLHPVRIYSSEKHKIVVILAEQIIDNGVADAVATALVDWIKKKGIKRVISTSGIRIPGGKGVYAFASNEQSKKIIAEHNIELVGDAITSGVTALLMLQLKDNKTEAFCLMGNARNSADYQAAAEIVKAFCSIIGVCLDVKPLLAEAKKIEDTILKHLQSMESKKEIPKKPMYTT